MVTPAAKQSLDGDESSTLRCSTNVKEELGQNCSEGGSAGNQNGPGGNSDHGVVSAAAAAKSLGKRKLLYDEDMTDDELETGYKYNTHLEANQGEELAREKQLGTSELPESSKKRRRCMILPAEFESKIDKAPTRYNIEAIVKLVRLAKEELRVMAVVTEPLWRHGAAGDGTRFLDKVAYRRIFPNLVGPTHVGFASEASRETARVKLIPKHLVNILMDARKWTVMFSAIVAKARTIDVLMNPGGATDYDGTLQVMAARYQLSTPLVPNRETYFARYCKKYSENDWIVVDVSLDSVHQFPVMTCKKRPSGCLIHGLSNGFSQISWVEHVDADYRGVSTLYEGLLVSGIGFGAKRWISTLDRRCQQMGSNISIKAPLRDHNQQLLSSGENAWKVLLKVAARMVYNFNSGISGSSGKWEKLSGHSTENDNIRVMIRRNMDDPSLPRGTLASAASSFWLPVSPKYVFDFFRDHNSGSEPLIPYTGREWEVLSDGNVIEQVCHISRGQEAINCVSIHKVLAENTSQKNIILLQESCSDPSGSSIVYSPVETEDMKLILRGRNSKYPRILPSGFAVHPDRLSFGPEGSSGSLLTISFQLLADGSPTFVMPAEMHSRLTDLINCTTERIKVALEGYISQVALFASMEKEL